VSAVVGFLVFAHYSDRLTVREGEGPISPLPNQLHIFSFHNLRAIA